MNVIIGCREISAGQEVINSIRKDGIDTGTVECLTLDLKSLRSVRNFARDIKSKNVPIHLLLNNAGIMFAPFEETEDGFESQFQVNYLSHFLLTHLLLPCLTTGGKSATQQAARVLNVSSGAHYGTGLRIDDLQLKDGYGSYLAYGHSKLLQVMFAKSLDEKLESQGCPVKCYSLHPGVVYTDLYQHVSWTNTFPSLAKAFFMNTNQGAETVVYYAVSPNLEHCGGQYFENGRAVVPNIDATDMTKCETVFQQTCKLLNIQEFGKDNQIMKN